MRAGLHRSRVPVCHPRIYSLRTEAPGTPQVRNFYEDHPILRCSECDDRVTARQAVTDPASHLPGPYCDRFLSSSADYRFLLPFISFLFRFQLQIPAEADPALFWLAHLSSEYSLTYNYTYANDLFALVAHFAPELDGKHALQMQTFALPTRARLY
jgi:hypothetical protein